MLIKFILFIQLLFSLLRLESLRLIREFRLMWDAKVKTLNEADISHFWELIGTRTLRSYRNPVGKCSKFSSIWCVKIVMIHEVEGLE